MSHELDVLAKISGFCDGCHSDFGVSHGVWDISMCDIHNEPCIGSDVANDILQLWDSAEQSCTLFISRPWWVVLALLFLGT